nr:MULTISPECIES: response regulator [Pseudomonas]
MSRWRLASACSRPCVKDAPLRPDRLPQETSGYRPGAYRTIRIALQCAKYRPRPGKARGETCQQEDARVSQEIQEPVGLRVLLVEDDATLRMLTTEVIEELDHQVTAVASAEAALELLPQREHDVLFTDIGLGGMSGIELTRRALAMDPTLRIVVASGYAFEREPGMEARVGVLIKPYDLNKIRQALADVQR